MTSTPRDAHFLHAQKALEPVLSAPLEEPRALCWVPGKEVLLVGCARGRVTMVEPAFGSRLLHNAVAEPVSMVAAEDRVAVLSREGVVEVWKRGESTAELRVETGLGGDAVLVYSGTVLAAIGEGAAGRRVVVFHEGAAPTVIPVPPSTCLGSDGEGGFTVSRSLESGVVTTRLGAPLVDSAATGHVLRAVGTRLLGTAVGGATRWDHGVPVTVRLLDTATAAMTRGGDWMALGTHGGVVAIGDMSAPPKLRGHPPRVSAHEGPVRGLGFSDRGRWLASVGENCRVWAY